MSFSVPERGVVALLGANGAGKSTVARAVTGLVPIETGSMLFDGRDIARLEAWKIARLGIVHAPEGRSVFGSLTVEENLTLDFAASSAANAWARVSTGPTHSSRVSASAGRRARTPCRAASSACSRSRAVLVNPPRLLVVDELSLGLAPKIIDDLYATLRQVNEAGSALLIIEQYVGRALALAQTAVILRHGEVTYEGSVAGMGDLSEQLLQTHSHVDAR